MQWNSYDVPFCRSCYLVSGIYVIRNQTTNYCYVGESVNIALRLEAHVAKLKSNIHTVKSFQEEFNKFGLDDYKFCVAAKTSDPLMDRSLLEVEWTHKINKKYKLYTEFNIKGQKTKSLVTKEIADKIRELGTTELSYREIAEEVYKIYGVPLSAGITHQIVLNKTFIHLTEGYEPPTFRKKVKPGPKVGQKRGPYTKKEVEREKSKYIGVYGQNGGFVVHFTRNGKAIYLGRYKKEDMAGKIAASFLNKDINEIIRKEFK